MSKLAEAVKLEAKAARLRKEAFEERPLPDFWRVGQKVKYLNDQEWAWNKGAIATVVQVREEDKGTPAKDYQVFWTSTKPGHNQFWTTPADVELVRDA